jgi:hypothetical protein
MHTPDDTNNRRIRQLIEQFNAEELYHAELQSALGELRELINPDIDLAQLVAALRKERWKVPAPPPINAIGSLIETEPAGR